VTVVVVGLAGQEKPSRLVEGTMVTAEAEIEGDDASAKLLVTSRQTDKARIAILVVIVPLSGYLELI
jgi:hypothetical protein